MHTYTVAAIFSTAPEPLAEVIAKLNIGIDKNGIYGVDYKHDYIKALSQKLAPEFDRLCRPNSGSHVNGKDSTNKFNHWEALDLVSVSYLLDNFSNLEEKYPLAVFTPEGEWVESPELSYSGSGYHKTLRKLETDWNKNVKQVLKRYAADSIALLVSCASD